MNKETNKNNRDKEFFRNMREQIKPDEEKIDALKNKIGSSVQVRRKPVWIGGACAAAVCVAIGAGLFLSDSGRTKDAIKTKVSESSISESDDSWLPKLIKNGESGEGDSRSAKDTNINADDSKGDESSKTSPDSGSDTSSEKDTLTDNNVNRDNNGNRNNTDRDTQNNGEDQTDNNGQDNNNGNNTNNDDKDNSNTDDSKTDDNGKDDDRDHAGVNPPNKDPEEFDENDPVYPEIYVKDEEKYNMTLNGKAFSFPAKFSDVADMGLWSPTLQEHTEENDPRNFLIEEGDSQGFSSTSGASITIKNFNFETVRASECDVMGLFIENYPDFSVGGIRSGSTIEDVNKLYGVNYTRECRTLTVHSGNGVFKDSRGTFTLTVVIGFNDGTVNYVGQSKIYASTF